MFELFCLYTKLYLSTIFYVKILFIVQLFHFSLIRETLQKLRRNFQMDDTTMECLQEASEQILVQYIQDISSIPDPPRTLAEARMKFMVMNFYLNYFQSKTKSSETILNQGSAVIE